MKIKIIPVCLLISGCASNPNCDPNVGGLVQGIRCANSGYAAHNQIYRDRLTYLQTENLELRGSVQTLENEQEQLVRLKAHLQKVRSDLLMLQKMSADLTRQSEKLKEESRKVGHELSSLSEEIKGIKKSKSKLGQELSTDSKTQGIEVDIIGLATDLITPNPLTWLPWPRLIGIGLKICDAISTTTDNIKIK